MTYCARVGLFCSDVTLFGGETPPHLAPVVIVGEARRYSMARRIANISNEDPIGQVRLDNGFTWRLLCAGSEEAVLTGVGSTMRNLHYIACGLSRLSEAQAWGSEDRSQGKFYSSALGVHRQGWGAGDTRVTPKKISTVHVPFNSVDLSGSSYRGKRGTTRDLVHVHCSSFFLAGQPEREILRRKGVGSGHRKKFRA